MQPTDAVSIRPALQTILSPDDQLEKLYGTHGFGIDRDTFMGFAQAYRDGGGDMAMLTDGGRFDYFSPMGQAFGNAAQELERRKKDEDAQASIQEQEIEQDSRSLETQAEQENRRLQSVAETSALANAPQQSSDDDQSFGRMLMMTGGGLGGRRPWKGAPTLLQPQSTQVTTGLARMALDRRRILSRVRMASAFGGGR